MSDQDSRLNTTDRLLRACNWILADAKASLDYADQVLVSREAVGELREALRREASAEGQLAAALRADWADSKLPQSDFAGLTARVASVAAAWSADALQSHDDLSLPMAHATVRRFANDIITRVHRITEIAQHGR